MKTTVIGAYPKIGDELPAQELRRALHRHDRGEISDAELDKVYDDVTRSTIGEIEAAGVDVVNDGQIRWDDLLAPFARTWSGVGAGPLARTWSTSRIRQSWHPRVTSSSRARPTTGSPIRTSPSLS